MKLLRVLVAAALVGPMSVALHGCAASVEHTFSKKDAGSTVNVKKGERFELRLGTPRGVAPEYRFDFGTPAVTGDALRFTGVERVPPPKNTDGGNTAFVFSFEAVAAGEATITIERDYVRPAEDGEARPGAHLMTVSVSG